MPMTASPTSSPQNAPCLEPDGAHAREPERTPAADPPRRGLPLRRTMATWPSARRTVPNGEATTQGRIAAARAQDPCAHLLLAKEVAPNVCAPQGAPALRGRLRAHSDTAVDHARRAAERWAETWGLDAKGPARYRQTAERDPSAQAPLAGGAEPNGGPAAPHEDENARHARAVRPVVNEVRAVLRPPPGLPASRSAERYLASLDFGRKDKLPLSTCVELLSPVKDERLGFARPKAASLVSTTSETYLVGPSVAFGASAKLVPMLRLRDGEPMAGKCLRNQPVHLAPGKHPNLSRFGTERTVYLADRDAFANHLRQELRANALFGGMAAVEHAFATPKTTYLVMPAFDCDLATAAKLCTNEQRRTLCRTVAPQLAEKLATMHAAGAVHFDFKPQNALIDLASLQVELSDFGACMALEPDGVHARFLGISTFPPPELVDDGGREKKAAGRRYGTALTDTWGFGAGLLMMMVPKRASWGHTPLYHQSEHLPGFAEWYKTRVVFGQLTRTELEGDDHVLSAYMRHAMLTDPHLTSLLLETCLTPDPNARASMPELARRLRRLRGPKVTNQDVRQLAAVLVARRDELPLHRAFAGLQRVHRAAQQPGFVAAANDWFAHSSDDEDGVIC